jgi:hypothetical protein
MQQHAEELCRQHDIVWKTAWLKRPVDSFALKECEEIDTAPIRSILSYATVLHEIGHVRGRHQTSRHRLVREVWAWRWARANALFWTPAMERYAAAALIYYARRPRRRRSLTP